MRNSFKRLRRYIEHCNRLNEFSYKEAVLNPERVVNRALFGTDYHPDEVSFQLNKVMKKYAEAIHMNHAAEMGNAYHQALITGTGYFDIVGASIC